MYTSATICNQTAQLHDAKYTFSIAKFYAGFFFEVILQFDWVVLERKKNDERTIGF